MAAALRQPFHGASSVAQLEAGLAAVATPIVERRPQRGFTLLEMIFVLMIMAIMAGLLSVSVVGRLDSVRVATAARDLTAALRFTRSQAILLRKEQFLVVNLEKRSYLAPGRPVVIMPERLDLKMLTASAEATSEKEGRIRFFPDGGSTGGNVRLISGEREWRVNVSWLTGEIELKDSTKDKRA